MNSNETVRPVCRKQPQQVAMSQSPSSSRDKTHKNRFLQERERKGENPSAMLSTGDEILPKGLETASQLGTRLQQQNSSFARAVSKLFVLKGG